MTSDINYNYLHSFINNNVNKIIICFKTSITKATIVNNNIYVNNQLLRLTNPNEDVELIKLIIKENIESNKIHYDETLSNLTMNKGDITVPKLSI
jgi:hypothetical protein